MLRSTRYRWLVLIACFSAFVAFAFVFQLMPPLVKTIELEFGIGDFEAGLLMSMVMIPGIFLAFPAGLLVNKYGFRLLGFFSIMLVSAGSLITAVSSTFAIALLGRVILGVGGAFIIVGAPTIIPRWFSHDEIGKAMGIYSANMPVATIVAFPAGTILMQDYSWRFPFYIGAVVASLVAALFVATIREDSSREPSHSAESVDFKHAIMNSEVWKASLVWMFFNTTAIAFLSWAPTLFQKYKNLPSLYASLLASVLMYAAVVFVPVFGWASDRSGRRKPFMVAGGILLGVALNATAYAFDTSLVLSVIVLGVTAAMVPPLVMAVAAENLPQNLAGTGFSVVTFFQNIGITLSVPLAGYIIQMTQSLPLTFLGISLSAFAAAMIASTLKTR